MSRIRDPYVRFCERDETEFIIQSHPTRCLPGIVVWANPTGVNPGKILGGKFWGTRYLIIYF